MKIINYITTMFACGIAASVMAVHSQPNIIFILCDDLGYGDLGVTGHPYVKSPNIDGLARDGMRFANAYMSGAWCAPSRAALMSGIYPARGFNGTHVLDVDGPSLPRMLKSAGYTTAHYGKWHLGPRKGGPSPDEYGIDDALVYNGTGPTWPKGFTKDPHYREKTSAGIVDLAIDFMKKSQDQPFFINLSVYPTHSYINPTPEQLAVYKELKVDIKDFENPLQREFLEFVAEHGDVQDAMRAYCADVTALDTEVGRLLQSLETLGLDENTMVIFTSDNGPGPLCNNWDNIAKRYKEKPMLLNNVGSSGPYRDRKISLHDGGIHAPFFVRWPAKIKEGTINQNTVFGGVDLLPTLATLAGAVSPDGLDGHDLSAAMLGRTQKRPEPLFWNDRPGWSAVREQQWKAHLQKGTFRLYDLSNDLSESNNVAKKYPEVAEKYLQELKQWEASFSKKTH
jgi:arylsulfatase A-like enzyme